MRLLTCALLTWCTSTAFASPLTVYYGQALLKKSTRAEAVTEHTFNQLIDHQQPELGTFAQHYFVDESYVQTLNAPTFLFICGEQACNPAMLEGLRPLAQRYHARLVAFEHRYYGQSQPRPTLSTDDLRFLTYENALHDLAAFETEAIHTQHWKGKWIAFGSSYSGVLAAYYHSTYPQLSVGAIASSAPVMPLPTFPQFDAYAAKLAGPTCTANVRKALTQIENATPEELAAIKTQFQAQNIHDKTDFLGLLADVTGLAIQFGMKDYFCFSIASSPLEGYAQFTSDIFNTLGMDPVQFTPEGAVSTDPNLYGGVIGLRQWTYQTCSEFGAWNTANADEKASLRSSLLNADYYQSVCKRLFGLETAPDISILNEKYYQPLLKSASNMHFTNGSHDPWSRMSLIAENNNTTNPHLRYTMIENGTHTEDLAPESENDSEPLKAARATTDALVGQWLQ